MTTTTLRPNGTAIAATSMTGAGSQHAALSDNSDSSYVTVEDKEGAGTYDVDTTTLPAGSITMRIRGRVRAQKVTDGVTTATVTAGSQEAALSGFASASFAEIVGAWTPVTLSQAQVDGVKIRLSVAADGVDTRFAEAYVDLAYVTIPVTTVTAVTPDPYTASNIVPIAWTNTLDADGGGQTRYEVKVFTAAQYGAGGFDPATSTPYWESGIVVGSALSTSTGPLATATTYRAYVRVSQTVNGAAHWSAWAYDQFAVTVTTADVDTVTATPQDTLGRIRVDVARDTGTSAWNFVEVQRSVDAGTTWTPVRFANYVDATGDANAFQVDDYEVGNGVNVRYRARATRLLSGLPITGEWVSTAAVTAWSSTDCWLKSPIDPTVNTVFVMSLRDRYLRQRRHGRFDIIGASFPVIISDVMSTHSGRITIETYETADAAALRALIEDTAVLLVQYPTSMDITDFYASIADLDEVFVSSKSDNLWRVWTASYDSVVAPADPTAGQ